VQVREKENYIMRKEAGGVWRVGAVSGSAGEQGKQLLTERCQELER
jgi:hypothetical protein